MMQFKWKVPKIALLDLTQSKQVMLQAINKGLNSMTEVVSTNIVWGAPAGATGRLKGTVGTSVSKYSGKVFTGVKYAPVIEVGRAAGKYPPSKQLINWIRLSTKGQKYYSNLKSKFGKITLKSAAFLLARSMYKRKRKANPFFQRGIDRSQKRLRLESGIMLRQIAGGLMS